MTLTLLFATHLTVAALAFLAGTRLRATSNHRREQGLKEYAEGCLRTASQAETWGFKRGYDKGLGDGQEQGQLEAIARGMSLRDQIDEIGDYST